MCGCVYVCMYACMYVCVYIYIYIYVCILGPRSTDIGTTCRPKFILYGHMEHDRVFMPRSFAPCALRPLTSGVWSL